MDLPRFRFCTSAFQFVRNLETATEVFVKFGINFKDVYGKNQNRNMH